LNAQECIDKFKADCSKQYLSKVRNALVASRTANLPPSAAGGTPSTFRSTLSVPPSLRPPSSSQPLRLQRPSRLSLPSPPPHPRPPSSRFPPLHSSTSSLLLHASRWDVGAIKFLKENLIEMFCLPSHSSIWSQPNDVGINKRLKKKWLKKAYGNYLRLNDNLTQGECSAIFARAGQVWA